MENKDNPDTNLNVPQSGEKNNDFENFLHGVDFGVLKEIAKNKAKSLNIDASYVDKLFVDKGKIESMTLLSNISSLFNVGGRFVADHDSVEKNKILLSDRTAKIMEFITNGELGNKEKYKYESILLSYLCHEEAHALSHHSKTDWEPTNIFVEQSIERSGLATRTIERSRILKIGGEERKKVYNYLDEGITDIFGEELFNAYATIYPQEDHYLRAYEGSRDLVESFIKKASDECEIDKEILQNAILKAKILGGDLEDKKVQSIFGDIFPEKFWKLLAKQNNGKSLILKALSQGRLKNLIEESEWSEKDKKRLRLWIKLFLKNPKDFVIKDNMGNVSDEQSSEDSQRIEDLRNIINNI